MRSKKLWKTAVVILGICGAVCICQSIWKTASGSDRASENPAPMSFSQIEQEPFVSSVRQAMAAYHTSKHAEAADAENPEQDTEPPAEEIVLLDAAPMAEWTVSLSVARDRVELSCYTVPETIPSDPWETYEWASGLITDSGQTDYFCKLYTARQSSERIILLTFEKEENDETVPFSEKGGRLLLYRQGQQAYLVRLLSDCLSAPLLSYSGELYLWKYLMDESCDATEQIRITSNDPYPSYSSQRTCFLYEDVKADELEEYGCVRHSTLESVLDYEYPEVPWGDQTATGIVVPAPTDSVRFYQMKVISPDGSILQILDLDSYQLNLQDWDGDGYMDLVETNLPYLSTETRIHRWDPASGQFLFQSEPYLSPDSIEEKLQSPSWTGSSSWEDALESMTDSQGCEPVIEFRDWSTPEWSRPLIRFTFCGRDTEDEFFPSWYYRMDVFSAESDAEPIAQRYLMFITPLNEDCIGTEDFTFDGIPDLIISEHTGSSNETYLFLAWGSSRNDFVPFEMLASSLSFSAEKNAVQCALHGSAASGSLELWQWFPGSLRQTGELSWDTFNGEFAAWEYPNGKREDAQLLWEFSYNREEVSQELDEQLFDSMWKLRDYIAGKYAQANSPESAEQDASDGFSLSYDQASASYTYQIFDIHGNILKEETGLSGNVYLEELPGHIVHLLISAGPEAKMNWFFDRESGQASEMFFNVSAVLGQRIAYMDLDGQSHFLVVQDMFDKEKGYFTFNRDFSPTAAGVSALPFAVFLDEDTLLIHYLKGEGYKRVREVIELTEAVGAE